MRSSWDHATDQVWRFGKVKLETDGEQHVFEVQIYLDDLDPEAVRVELYANGFCGCDHRTDYVASNETVSQPISPSSRVLMDNLGSMAVRSVASTGLRDCASRY